MTTAKSKSKKSNPISTTSLSIDKQTEDFLKNGGQITFVDSGISGFNYNKTSNQTTSNDKKEK